MMIHLAFFVDDFSPDSVVVRLRVGPRLQDPKLNATPRPVRMAALQLPRSDHPEARARTNTGTTSRLLRQQPSSDTSAPVTSAAPSTAWPDRA
jgi:hypothetical protein